MNVTSENMNGESPTPPVRSWVQTVLIGRNPRRTLARVAFVIIASFVFLRLFIPIRVSGVSMAPNYVDGRINFVNKLAYHWKRPKRGDVVAIRMAGEHVMLLKRIIALPGETFGIHRGIVLVNGKPLDEPYIKFRREAWEYKELTLAQDAYMVIGDNRSMARENHYFGVAYAHQIVGKVLF